MSVFLGQSRYFIGFMSFLEFFCQSKSGMGVFLPLDLKLELGPPLSTLGGCAVFNLGGGIGNSGVIMLGPEVDM